MLLFFRLGNSSSPTRAVGTSRTTGSIADPALTPTISHQISVMASISSVVRLSPSVIVADLRVIQNNRPDQRRVTRLLAALLAPHPRLGKRFPNTFVRNNASLEPAPWSSRLTGSLPQLKRDQVVAHVLFKPSDLSMRYHILALLELAAIPPRSSAFPGILLPGAGA